MTHVTGPRAKIVRRMAKTILEHVIPGSGATVSEIFEAFHEVQMKLVRGLLTRWEDDCHTCPKPKRKA